jgi:integrase
MSGSGGQLRQRSNGLWEGRYWQNGRRRSVYAPSKREAQERLRAALTQVDNGIKPVTSRVTVAEWLDEWLATSVATRCRPRTIESYGDTVRRYIAPAVGRKPLAKLDAADIARMLSDLSARGDLSPTTQRYAYSVLRIALGRAYKSGRVLRNVATLVDPPAKARREMPPLSADQARAFLEATASDRLGPLYALAIATGMRQGELLALRWRDVDLEGGWLAVRHTLRRGTRELAEPKTDRARRTLKLGTEVVSVLREHRRQQGTIDPDAFVFATRDGRPLDSRNVTQDLQTALRRAKLPQQRFHDLRHAYATLMIEAGEELSMVSRSLGHADLSTTADVYAHLTPAMLERSAARMDTILRRREAV